MLDIEAETTKAVDEAWRRGLALEPQMTVSEWADRHRVLPAANAEPGPWRTSRVPYLRDIMDDLSVSSPVERIVFMKGAQIGATEAGLNAIGYWIAHAPGLILAVWPSIDMVRRNSRTRLEPLIEGTPAIRAKIVPPKTKEPGNTITLKEFPGGALVMTGANSATGLRSTAARYLVCDEVDAFPADANEEGDPVALATQRTVTFRGRRKICLISTPTIAGASRIEKAYAESDQRRFFVPCPQCGTLQTLRWSSVRWPEGAPRQAYYICEQGCVIDERDKPAMLAAGRWLTTADGDGVTRGYHLSALYSPFETWGEIAIDFLAAKGDPMRFKTWVNLKLGEPFEDRETAALHPETLQARAEDWGELLPDGAAVLTCGIDVQDGWLAVEIVAWGAGEESWSLAYETIHGDTSRAEPWEALEAILSRRFRHCRAVSDLPIAATTIDSGGHRTDWVMNFSAQRLNRRVWAIKGRGGDGVRPWPKRPPKAKRASIAPVHIVGVNAIKATLYSRLRMTEAAGPGVCHFPEARDELWYRELVAERAVRKWIGGAPRIEWVKGAHTRNEGLDCRVYATAALHGLYAAGLNLNEAAARIAEAPIRKAAPEEQSPAALTAPKTIRSKWMNGN